MVSNALYAAVIRDYPATIAVDQTANEVFGRPRDQFQLSLFQGDLAMVFLTGTVLWEQAWPVFRIH